MLSAEEAVQLAIDEAERGLLAGEMPIGAVVFAGDDVLGRAHTKEETLGRRIVHADLLAMLQADEALGFTRPEEPLTLAVNLEPCMMCLGAAITLGVKRVYFALESPNDGGVDLLALWNPPVEQEFFSRPAIITGGIQRQAAQSQFHRYSLGSGPAGMREWAGSLARL